MTAILERPAPSGSPQIHNDGLPLKINGRPRKLKRDQNFTVFFDADRLARLEAFAEQIKNRAVEGQGLGRDRYFRSAALRGLIDRGFPAIESTSAKREHKNVNITFTCYMNEDYLTRLNDFVKDVERTMGKEYSRSSALRDLIDAHL